MSKVYLAAILCFFGGATATFSAGAAAVPGEDDASLRQWMQWYEGSLGGLVQDGVLQQVEAKLEGADRGLTEAPAADLDMVRRLRLQALLGVGHPREAIRVFETWAPEDGRRALQYRWHGGEKPFYWKFFDSTDVILGLATAYALEGQDAVAQALLTSSELEDHSSALARGLVHWLRAPADDPFDLLVDLSDSSSLQEPRGMVLRLLMALAQREGYIPFSRLGAQTWKSLLDTEHLRLAAESDPSALGDPFDVTRDRALEQWRGLHRELAGLEQTLPPVVLPDSGSLRRQFDFLAEAELELFVLDRAATRALVIYNRASTRGMLRLELEGDDWVDTGVILTFSCHFPTEQGTTD